MMSWPRSHGFPHSESLDGDGEHTPSEIRAYERLHMPDDASDHSQQVSDMAEACADPGTADEQGRWRCVTCQSASWDWENEQYRCRQCGSSRFFDTTRPFRVDMADGVWVFEPKSSPDQSPARSGSSFDLFGSTGDQVPHHTTSRSPPEPDDGQWNDGEYAESEQLTNDPTVDPDASDAGGRRRRRRRKPADVTTSGPQQQQQQVGMSDLLTVMKQLVNDKSSKPESTSAASWNSRRGPEPGIKWRGGTPPSPPLWKYSSSDLRAFSRWEKKIRIWQLQVRNYVSSADGALMLFTSLTGEAEQEVEHIDLAKVNAKDGVDYLLDALRGPLQQKELFQKRKLLSDYEQVSRMSHESIRQYINRYRRIEKDLESIGISSSTMYDSESRGNRVLERAKLSPEFQRLVLIGAGNTLEFDRVCESLLLQFPDFKPVPPIFSNYAGPGSNNSQGWRSSSGKGKASSSQSSAASTASGSSMGSSSFSKSSGKGRFPRKVLQTDIATGQDDEVNDDLPTVEEADEDEFHDPNDDDPEFDAEDHGGEHDEAADEASSESQLHSTIAEIAEVLTVTSKKLQSSVLGRKFTGRKSIEERKKNSSCSACGQMGHSAGDSVCPVSSKGKDGGGKSSGKSSRGSAPSSSSTYNNKPKKAFVVTLPQNQEEPEVYGKSMGSQPSTYFTYMLNHIDLNPVQESFVTEVIDFAGFMVLDTACQRSCCSYDWLRIHEKILSYHNMCCKKVDATDVFQFGAGGPKTSTVRAYIPVALDGQDTQGILLGASVVDANIPFLASRTLLERLGCIIDFSVGKLIITKLGLQVPLMLKHGHLAVKISCFQKTSSIHSVGVIWVNQMSGRTPILSLSQPVTKIPPTWLKAWRELVIKLMMVPFRTFRAMSRMVKLGLKHRDWLTLEERFLQHQEQTTKVEPPPAWDCIHADCRRYGNRHGRFAECKRCLQRFRWDDNVAGWLVRGGDKSASSTRLPAPSSSNIIPPSLAAMASPKNIPKAPGKMIMASTAKSKATSSTRVPQQIPIWEEHGLTFEQYDQIMMEQNEYRPPDSDDSWDGYPDTEREFRTEDFYWEVRTIGKSTKVFALDITWFQDWWRLICINVVIVQCKNICWSPSVCLKQNSWMARKRWLSITGWKTLRFSCTMSGLVEQLSRSSHRPIPQLGFCLQQPNDGFVLAFVRQCRFFFQSSRWHFSTPAIMAGWRQKLTFWKRSPDRPISQDNLGNLVWRQLIQLITIQVLILQTSGISKQSAVQFNSCFRWFWFKALTARIGAFFKTTSTMWHVRFFCWWDDERHVRSCGKQLIGVGCRSRADDTSCWKILWQVVCGTNPRFNSWWTTQESLLQSAMQVLMEQSTARVRWSGKVIAGWRTQSSLLTACSWSWIQNNNDNVFPWKGKRLHFHRCTVQGWWWRFFVVFVTQQDITILGGSSKRTPLGQQLWFQTAMKLGCQQCNWQSRLSQQQTWETLFCRPQIPCTTLYDNWQIGGLNVFRSVFNLQWCVFQAMFRTHTGAGRCNLLMEALKWDTRTWRKQGIRGRVLQNQWKLEFSFSATLKPQMVMKEFSSQKMTPHNWLATLTCRASLSKRVSGFLQRFGLQWSDFIGTLDILMPQTSRRCWLWMASRINRYLMRLMHSSVTRAFVPGVQKDHLLQEFLKKAIFNLAMQFRWTFSLFVISLARTTCSLELLMKWRIFTLPSWLRAEVRPRFLFDSR